MTRKYLRLTLNERFQHLNLMINFTILVITGFALKYPTAFWVSPIAEAPAGMTIRGFIHRLSGVAILVLGGYHLLYLIFTERGRQIALDMIPKWKDARDLWETLKNNLFINRPAKEIKMGRFNYREKLEYLALVWGTFVMGATGFILWYEVQWLRYFPKWTYEVAQAVHFYEAILATLAIVVWHFYSVLLDPDVYPMSWAWITGHLTEHEMKLEHGLELEKIVAGGKGELVEVDEGASAGGGRIYPAVHAEGVLNSPFHRLYETVIDLNEAIKGWRGT
jgi:cytochrome b subunit of formate dehydrogenase